MIVALIVTALCAALFMSLAFGQPPMPVGKIVGPLDALQQLADGQVIDGSGDDLEEVVILGAGFAPQPIDAVGVLIQVDARVTMATGTYKLEFFESSDGQTWTSTDLIVPLTAVGQYQRMVGLTKDHVKGVLTIAGAGMGETPSITLSAWLTRE